MTRLVEAKKNKNDEFYTQYDVVEAELQHYTDSFIGKTVLCNCDDPYESSFFKYFVQNFKVLGLKKLISVSYADSQVANTDVSACKTSQAYKVVVTQISDGDSFGLSDIKKLIEQKDRSVLEVLSGTGDFRSAECVELLKEADIVVTNPPFSLFREFVAQLIEYDKKFIILGALTSITNKEVSALLCNNVIRLGVSIKSGDREFRVPPSYPLSAKSCRVDPDGTRYVRVTGIRWFTNLATKQTLKPIELTKRLSEGTYRKYANCDAINIDKVSEIPCDYYGVMGVPITFLDKWVPSQFRVVGIRKGDDGKDLYYLNADNKKEEPYYRVLIQRVM